MAVSDVLSEVMGWLTTILSPSTTATSSLPSRSAASADCLGRFRHDVHRDVWPCLPLYLITCVERGRLGSADDADLLWGRGLAAVDLRDDDGGPDGEKDDDRSDPEDAASDALEDLAQRDEADVAEVGARRRTRRRDGRARRLRRGLDGESAPSSSSPENDAQPHDDRDDDQDEDEPHPTASRNTSDSRRRSNENSVTRPARHGRPQDDVAVDVVVEHEPDRAGGHLRDRHAWEPRAQSAVRSPSTRTTSRRAPLLASSSTVPDTTRRPWSMIITCSHRSSTRSSWWLEKSTQHPARAWSTRTWPMASMPVGSSPDSGSSRTSSSGSCTSAAASWTRCWFPCESASTLLVDRSAMSRRSSQVCVADAASCGTQPVQPAEILDLLTDQHAGIEASLLGHVAEAPPLRATDRRAVPSDDAGVEIGQAEDGAHGRRLAGAVGPEEAHDLTARHREGEVVERDQRPEGAPQPFELQQASHWVQARRAAMPPGHGGCHYGWLAPFSRTKSFTA